jgi:hypothetical protein
LARYDLNKDGVIDRKDPVYKKLVLWKDVSGEGVFHKKDSIVLRKKIKSISLKYRSVVEAADRYAEYRQKAEAEVYSVEGKKRQKALVVDVWFKPSFGQKNVRQLSSK